MTEKKTYETPTVAVVGTFESITQAATSGSTLDATFPGGTPTEDLTFSD